MLHFKCEFTPYYLDKTPSPATMDRIKARYPLNGAAKKVIKRYEKQAPGELAHIDLSKVPKDIRPGQYPYAVVALGSDNKLYIDHHCPEIDVDC